MHAERLEAKDFLQGLDCALAFEVADCVTAFDHFVADDVELFFIVELWHLLKLRLAGGLKAHNERAREHKCEMKAHLLDKVHFLDFLQLQILFVHRVYHAHLFALQVLAAPR